MQPPTAPLNAGTTANEVENQPSTNGSSYIRLPAHIEAKNAVTNPQNFSDERCLQYAFITSVVCPEKAHRVSVLRKYSHLFNWEGLNFSVKVRDLGILEKNNPDYSVKVYGLNQWEKIYPIRVERAIPRRMCTCF